MYQVIDSTGQSFGPVAIETLRQWAIERRLTPDMILVEEATGNRGPAGEMLVGMNVFLDPIPASPEPDQVVQPSAPVQPISYAYKGSNEPGQPPTLQNRAVAFLIDFVFGMMVFGSLHATWDMLFVRFQYNAWSVVDYVDYLFIPATALYFLFRDAAFKGQSIGKRIAKLKVVTTNGKKLTPMHSLLRNISAAPMFLLPLPYIVYAGIPLLVFAFLVECFMVMTQGKRLGDTFAMTTVVNE